jgi:hypothetical protein
VQTRHIVALGWIAGITAVAGLLHAIGLSIPVLLLVGGIVAVIALVLPRLGIELLDHAIHAGRAALWRRDGGRYHSHRGLALRIEDDGRHVWLAGADLQRQLGSNDSDAVLCARHAGRWRRDAQGGLMLRVDAVVAVLSTQPGRADPRIVRFRRYLEREVLFPAQERHRRAA